MNEYPKAWPRPSWSDSRPQNTPLPMLRAPIRITSWPAAVRDTPFSWVRYRPKKVVNRFCAHPEVKASRVISHTAGCRNASMGQALAGLGRRVGGDSASGGWAGRSRTNSRDMMPTASTMPPNSCQLRRQPASSPAPPVSSGTASPAMMKAMLPPEAARPAAKPRSRRRNQADNRPIIGVRAAPPAMPISTAAARAMP